MEIAFIGMGIMGSAMAGNCLKYGYPVTVWNRTRAKCAPLEQAGAEVAATPAEAARGRTAVMVCVENTADVEAVVFGENGAAHGMEAGQLLIDHSTISASATERFAARLAERTGAQWLDAPVSGGDVGAREGTLSIMVGGPLEAFERAQPFLLAMGRTIVHVGPRVGDGQRCKMINQLLGAVHCLATTEAMRLAETLGLDTGRVHAAVSQGAAGSWSLSNLGPKWLAREFAPGFRLRHMLKDLNFCAEAVGERSSPDQFPALKLARELFGQAEATGYGDNNIHGVARIFKETKTD